MSPHAAPPALLSNPIHENGTFRGWPRPITSSVPKNHPFSELARHLPQDLPCQGPFSWKVLRFSGGPSMLGAVFLEGPAFFKGTFHARGRFPGRSLSKCSWSALFRDTRNEKRSFCSWSTLFRDTWSSEALDSRDAATEPKHLSRSTLKHLNQKDRLCGKSLWHR